MAAAPLEGALVGQEESWKQLVERNIREYGGRDQELQFRRYMQDLTTGSVVRRVGVIAVTTTGGAAIGMGVGLAVGGAYGAGIGAAIGAGSGLGTGLFLVSAYSAYDYSNWRKNQEQEEVATLFRRISEAVDPELLCPITNEPPMDPVIGPNTPHVYERTALEAWVRERGTDPQSRAVMRVDQIEESVEGLGKLNKIFSEVVLKEIAGMPIDDNSKLGLRLKCEHYQKKVTDRFNSAKEGLDAKMKAGAISMREYGQRLADLTNQLDPIIPTLQQQRASLRRQSERMAAAVSSRPVQAILPEIQMEEMKED